MNPKPTMAEPEVVIEEDDQLGDEDMAEVEIEDGEPTYDDGGPTGLEDIEPTFPERTTFLEYERSNSFRSPLGILIDGSIIASCARP